MIGFTRGGITGSNNGRDAHEQELGFVWINVDCYDNFCSVGAGMEIDLTIPDDLSIPEFLKRKVDPNVPKTYPRTNNHNQDAGVTLAEGIGNAEIKKRTIAATGEGAVPEPSVPRDKAYDALLRKIKRRTRKHQEPTRLSKRK